MAQTDARGRRKTLVGRVLSNQANKTIVVEVTWRTPHPFYGKVVRRRSKFAAHDESNSANAGDTVLIMETRPISKTKRWRLAEILEKVQ
ncbi:MAG: 30S ribosomal protein S17 [Candidatus Latescibacteria bacterium]|nr:30S ribosomal protein S17 [Candidatus Latescibacterota bacterium]